MTSRVQVGSALFEHASSKFLFNSNSSAISAMLICLLNLKFRKEFYLVFLFRIKQEVSV